MARLLAAGTATPPAAELQQRCTTRQLILLYYSPSSSGHSLYKLRTDVGPDGAFDMVATLVTYGRDDVDDDGHMDR
jgi:hypothetical protein